jgi:hypothetical protein
LWLPHHYFSDDTLVGGERFPTYFSVKNRHFHPKPGTKQGRALKRVSQKGTLFLFIGVKFISFAPPKEMNQRKGGRKRQPHPVCPPATQALLAPPNRARFAPFPACLRANKINTYIPI